MFNNICLEVSGKETKDTIFFYTKASQKDLYRIDCVFSLKVGRTHTQSANVISFCWISILSATDASSFLSIAPTS